MMAVDIWEKVLKDVMSVAVQWINIPQSSSARKI